MYALVFEEVYFTWIRLTLLKQTLSVCWRKRELFWNLTQLGIIVLCLGWAFAISKQSQQFIMLNICYYQNFTASLIFTSGFFFGMARSQNFVIRDDTMFIKSNSQKKRCTSVIWDWSTWLQLRRFINPVTHVINIPAYLHWNLVFDGSLLAYYMWFKIKELIPKKFFQATGKVASQWKKNCLLLTLGIKGNLSEFVLWSMMTET